MTKLIALFLVLLALTARSAPLDYQWARRAGGTGDDFARAIAIDPQGNSYVTGAFQGTASFGTSTNLVSGGGYDAFVAKYSRGGDLQWAKRISGAGECQGWAIAVDQDGNSCVAGHFVGNVDFGSTNVTASNQQDIFLAKYDANGAVVWARRLGGTGDERCGSIALDADANIYLAGTYTGTISVAGRSFTCAGVSDLLVVKFNAAGTSLWARNISSALGKQVTGDGAAVDPAGNCLVVARFNGSVLAGSTAVTATGNPDLLVAKLDSAGNFLWARKPGGVGYVIASEEARLAAGQSGDAYVCGQFSGSISFGPSSITSSGTDIFVAKIQSAGNFAWGRAAGGSGADGGRAVAVDRLENIYVAAVGQSPAATFGSLAVGNNGDNDILLAKLNSAGDFLWATNSGGTGYDSPFALAAGNAGHVVMAGTFQNTSLLGVASAGANDALVAALLDFAGPVLQIENAPAGVTVRWAEALGTVQLQRTPGLSPQAWQDFLAPTSATFASDTVAEAQSFYRLRYLLPTITVHPQSQTVDSGATRTLEVAAYGSAALSYQWEYNNEPLPGATAATLILSAITTAQAGDYRVVIKNAFGTATSQTATVTVNPP